MRLYQFPSIVSEEPDTYYGTRDQGKEALNKAVDPQLRREFTLNEVEVKTDKESLIKLLNGEIEPEVVRSWHGTVRGGLKEILPAGADDSAEQNEE